LQSDEVTKEDLDELRRVIWCKDKPKLLPIKRSVLEFLGNAAVWEVVRQKGADGFRIVD